jgi:hypothetical protein
MVRLLLFALTWLSLYAGSINGVVTDITGAGIPAAKLVAIGWNGDRIEAMSDPAGHFVFADLQAGDYSIEISVRGFLNRKIEDLQVRVGEEKALPAITLSVAAIEGCTGPFPPVVVYTPIPAGRSRLSGRAFLAGNNRAAGALVLLYEPKNHRKAGSAVANSSGDFLFIGLRPGLYQLRVRLSGFAELVMEGVEIRAGFRSETENFSLAPCPHGAACSAVKWVSVAICL